jgi:hypothetical protein
MIGAGPPAPQKMSHRHPLSRRTLGSPQFTTFAILGAVGLFLTIAVTTSSPANSPQEKQKKSSALRWDPPRVDAPILSLSATPSCSLPDVLTQAGQRADELLDHLQKFTAKEQIRYQQTDRLGVREMYLATKFEYLVDFGKQSEPFNVHEIRTPLAGSEAELTSILDKGLPVLALIFHPALQGDYEMRCEGATQWNHQPAWLVHFRQMKGKRPRTLTMETQTEGYPRSANATELRPLRIKGRAWIAADSGQVIHLETNLVEPILMIDLSEIAISVDYATVRSHSLNVELWLPQFAVSYTDYAKRRMIVEHTFSDFLLFAVQTQETIRKPNER